MAGDNAPVYSGFSAGETKLIMCLIKHLKGDLPSDFEAVAEELGYKDASIVKTRWGQIKRKKITAGGLGASEKVTPRKRKTKGEGADGADDEEETPKPKRGRKPKVKDEKVKEESEEEANAMETIEKSDDDESK